MAECVEPRMTDSWYKLYGESWKGAIIDEAFAHPAKFSRALIWAIYDHAVEESWLKPGDRVLDPFGGVALGALDAMRLGLNWIGCELEPKFVELGTRNIQLWNEQFRGVMPNWGTAWLYQGDSRYLVALLSRANLTGHRATLSSPPFGAGETRDRQPVQDGSVSDCITRAYTQDRQGIVEGNLAHLDDEEGFEVAVSSPPFAQVDHKPTKLGEGKGKRATGGSADRNKGDYHYPDSPGQLAVLGEGQFETAVSSPPYESGCRHTGGTDPHPEHIEGGDYHGLGIKIAVSSPPFEGSVGSDDPDKRGGLYRDSRRRNDVSLTGTYGKTNGQLGAMKPTCTSCPNIVQSGQQTGQHQLEVQDVCSVQQEAGEQGSLGRPLSPTRADTGADSREVEGACEIRPSMDVQIRDKSTPVFGKMQRQLYPRSDMRALGIPQCSEESNMRPVRSDDESVHSSHRFRPLQQSSRQPTSSMCELPHESSQEGLLGCRKSGGRTAEVEWPNRMGTVDAIEATISSPPFESSISRDTVDAETRVRLARERGVAAHDIRPIEVEKVGKREQEYGQTEGQLGTMEGGFDSTVTSPPYLPRSDRCIPAGGDHEALQRRDIEAGHAPVSTFRTSYSDNPDNLGNPTGVNQETFWGAARVIVEQVYQLLAPGGHAIWVLKAFVRKGKIVDFPGQWQQLCESVGFRAVHYHRCWVIEDNGTQLGMFGEDKDMIKERKSFFRRLAEKRGSPRIDYEVVLCLVKP